MLFVHKINSEHEQIDKPPSVTTQAYPTSLPRLLQQKPRVRFAKKSDAISMKMTTSPTKEVFEDPFPQDLESLFLKEDVVSTKSSSEDTTTAEVINALVKPTESVEDTKALLANISGQLSGIGAGSQESDQRSQAEGFVPVEASVLVKNKGIADEGEREVSCCGLDKYVQTDYLHNAERPETRGKLCLRSSHQSDDPGGRIVGLVHQIWEFNNRILERVEHTIRTQSTQRPDDPGGNTDQSRRHHWSNLSGGIVC